MGCQLKRAYMMIQGLLLLGLAGLGWAAEPLPDDCMPSSQVQVGMIGEGRTVFQGFKVEPFKVEILGVQHNAMSGSDMILAKLEGKFLEKHGVVAGMSGSPVYINGKVIGAVAYGWSFAYAPYCGITPIEQMWTVFQSIGRPGVSTLNAAGSGGVGQGAGSTGAWDWQAAWQEFEATVQGQRQPLAAEAAGFQPKLAGLAKLGGEMKPLWSPLFLSGASPRTEKMLRGFFASHGLEMLGAGTLAGSGAGSTPPGPNPPFENGSSLGVPILSGDLSLSGVGTVTYCRGDKLVAFGHPMFFSGSTAAPMAPAYIFGFMQSYERSFKLSDVGDVVGTIDQDRLFAIGGKVGAAPPRVPITVSIHGPAVSRPRDFHFSCWKNRNFLPVMTATAASESYVSSVSEGGELTVRMSYRITLAGGRVIQKQSMQSARASVMDQPVSNLLMDMFMLIDNPFQEADVESINVDWDVQPEAHQELLLSVRPEHDLYRAGDTVRLAARFQPWRGPEFERKFTMALPRDLKPGPYVIHLVDSAGALRIERSNHPDLFQPRSFAEVVDLVQADNISDDEMRLYLVDPSMDLTVNGYDMGQLPGTVESLIRDTAPPQLQQQALGRLLATQAQRSVGTFRGSQSLAIQVVDHLDE